MGSIEELVNELELGGAQSVSSAEAEFRVALAALASMAGDMEGRPVCVTPFSGRYGTAGYVLAVNGSPPRGLVVAQVDGHGRLRAATVLGNDGRARRIRQPAPGTSGGKHWHFWQATAALIAAWEEAAQDE